MDEFIWNQGRIKTYGDAQVTDPETNRRFDRLEVKIDKLTEVLTNVARVEEKLIGGSSCCHVSRLCRRRRSSLYVVVVLVL